MNSDMNAQFRRIHERQLTIMQNDVLTIGHILKGINREQATQLRDPNDGDKGWTVLQVVCHVRDFDPIFLARARQMVNENNPTFVGYDVDEMASKYGSEDLMTAYNQLVESRKQAVEYFKSLNDEQWLCPGTHPIYGPFSVTDQAQQFCSHDSIHIEQILKILAQQ
jgi:hypothetical protein